MANENSNEKSTDPGNNRVLPHKFHKDAGGGLAGEAQQDSPDVQPGEGQPEIPKVGSRDAPGG
jgi:hypothetical protein